MAGVHESTARHAGADEAHRLLGAAVGAAHAHGGDVVARLGGLEGEGRRLGAHRRQEELALGRVRRDDEDAVALLRLDRAQVGVGLDGALVDVVELDAERVAARHGAEVDARRQIALARHRDALERDGGDFLADLRVAGGHLQHGLMRNLRLAFHHGGRVVDVELDRLAGADCGLGIEVDVEDGTRIVDEAADLRGRAADLLELLDGERAEAHVLDGEALLHRLTHRHRAEVVDAVVSRHLGVGRVRVDDADFALLADGLGGLAALTTLRDEGQQRRKQHQLDRRRFHRCLHRGGARSLVQGTRRVPTQTRNDSSHLAQVQRNGQLVVVCRGGTFPYLDL